MAYRYSGPQKVACLLTVLSLLVGAWLVSGTSAPRACFSSPLVSQLIILRNGQTKSIPQCGLEGVLSFKRSWSPQDLNSWQSRLQALAQWTDQFGKLRSPVRLIVDADNGLTEKSNGTTMILGIDRANSLGQLERTFLKIWFLQNAPLSSALEQEILADLAWAYLHNGFELADPVSHHVARYSDMNWMRWIYTWRGICRSPWATSSIEPICNSMRAQTLSANLKSEYSPVSLRPLVGASLWRTYQHLPVVAKAQFFESLIKRLRGHHAHFLDQPEFDSDGVVRARLVDGLKRQLKQFGQLLSPDLRQTWSEATERALVQPNIS